MSKVYLLEDPVGGTTVTNEKSSVVIWLDRNKSRKENFVRCFDISALPEITKADVELS